MKTKEFNLSEKIDDAGCSGKYNEWIFVEDVKEFIQLLKKEIKVHYKCDYKDKDDCLNDINKVIDKLAGEELSK